MADKFTVEQLNSMDKDILIQLFIGLQDRVEALTDETKSLNDKMQLLIEQVVLGNRNRFGRKSEKMTDPHQMRLEEVDGEIVLFNEAEAECNLDDAEPEDLEPPKNKPKKRTKGKKEMDMSDIPVIRTDYYKTVDELNAIFGENGWKQLPDQVSKRYIFTPAKIEVEEVHVGVYASKDDDRMEKADHPESLLRGSVVTPSLAAAIINGKYVNAMPLYRLEKEFERYGLAISRRTMANWMIRLAEEYLGIVYDFLHTMLLVFHVIQADETPVLVNRDGRPAGTKSWMWVYRSGYMYQDRQVILYQYQKTRNASHPREFLKGYSGICVTDGYQVYHTVEGEFEELTIAGCWVHCRRRFDEALTVLPKEARNKSLAYTVMKQIQAIYREEGKLKELPAEERLLQREVIIKPLVDALFAYLKRHSSEVPGSGKLHEAFTYALNQEKYLRVFLTDGEVPVDNNASERAIRGFCIGKKNWEFIETLRGADSSAIIYSIAETAKANNLKPYNYFEFLLTEIPKHMNDTDKSFLEDLMPWSPKLPESIRKPKKQ